MISIVQRLLLWLGDPARPHWATLSQPTNLIIPCRCVCEWVCICACGPGERELQDCQHPSYVIWLFIRFPSGMRGLCHSSKRLDIMEIAKWIVLSEPECIIQMQIVFLLIKVCGSLRRIAANTLVILIKFISASKTSILTYCLCISQGKCQVLHVVLLVKAVGVCFIPCHLSYNLLIVE